MSVERTNRRHSYPKNLPLWVAIELREEALARGDDPPNIVGKHSSQLRGRARLSAEQHERRLREETAIQRVRRIAKANAARRGRR